MIPTQRVEFMPGAGPFDEAGDYYLKVTSASSSNATTPDHANLDITTDMEVRVDATLDSWTTPTGTGMELFGKFAPPSNQSWLLWINSNRRLVFRHSPDGTAVIDNVCPVALPVTTGRLAVAAIIDVDNGTGSHTVFFYTAPTMAGPWTLLSATLTAGTTSIFNSTASVGVGNVPISGFNAPSGRIHAAQIYAGTGSTDVRANPDFAAQPPGTTSFADTAPTPKTWTVGAAASIAGFDWVDITSRFLSSTVTEGREDDLMSFGPGDQTLVLDNRDRHLDPTYTDGPWFGELQPRTPFRFRMSDDGGSTWYDRFYGFARGGFRQAYFEGGTFSTCTVALQDLLAVIADYRLPASTYAGTILTDRPKAYWTLDESNGIQMADSSGYGRHGRYDNSTLGEDPLVEGDGASVYMPHVGDNRGEWSGQGLPEAAPCSLEAWVKTPRDALAIKTIIAAQRDNSLGSQLWLMVAPAASGSPNGEFVVDFFGLGSFYKARGHTRIDDDRPHHVVCTINGTAASDVVLYVDGVQQTKTLVSGTSPGTWASHLIWTIGNTANNGFGDYGVDGWVDEVAVYDYVLSSEQVTDHYDTGITAHDGDRVDERIDRILDIIGVPSGLRDIALADTTLGPANYAGDSAGAYLQRVVESEQGYFYVNHRDGGKITFRGRYHRLTDSRSTTPQATFTDDDTPAAGEYNFKDVTLDSNGIDSIVNEVEVRWRGGTETVSDDISIAAYGPQGRTLTTEAPTPSAAQSAGGWMVSRYGQPQSRVRSLKVNPGADDDLWPAVLDLRIGDRVAVTYTPQGVGSAISEELIVEGIRSELRGGLSWEMTYALSDADDTKVWIWGTSTWGETTIWG